MRYARIVFYPKKDGTYQVAGVNLEHKGGTRLKKDRKVILNMPSLFIYTIGSAPLAPLVFWIRQDLVE